MIIKDFKSRAWDGETMHYDVLTTGEGGSFYEHVLILESDLTLMLFSGLCDQNKVDIFESDIVNDHSYDSKTNQNRVGIGIIKYGDFWINDDSTSGTSEAFGFYIEYVSNEVGYFTGCKPLYPLRASCCEVVGNIYEGYSND